MSTNSRTGLFIHFRNSYNHRINSGHKVRDKRHSLTGDEDMLIVDHDAKHLSHKEYSPIDIEWHQWIKVKDRLETQLRSINNSS